MRISILQRHTSHTIVSTMANGSYFRFDDDDDKLKYTYFHTQYKRNG